MKYALLFVLLVALPGCVNIDYFGKHYPPTGDVEVFMTKVDVTRPYEVIGYITVKTGEHANSEGAIMEMRRKAMEVGGHALILHQPTQEISGVRTTSRGNSATKARAKETRKGVKADSRTRTRKVAATRVIKRKILKADVLRFK